MIYIVVKIFLIDPTKKAITHFEEVKKYYNNGDQFKGNIQVDYYDKIKGLNPDFTKFSYENIGLWDKKKSLKFYKQSNPNYVSQSLITNMFSDKYDIIKVDTIKSIMKKNKHTKIDLLKLDIEGAEIKVLNQMLNDNIKPKYLCIEFDLKLKKKDKDDLTNKILKRLSDNGYKILINDNLNITFELK